MMNIANESYWYRASSAFRFAVLHDKVVSDKTRFSFPPHAMSRCGHDANLVSATQKTTNSWPQWPTVPLLSNVRVLYVEGAQPFATSV